MRQKRDIETLTKAIDEKITESFAGGVLEGLEGDARIEKVGEISRDILLDLVENKYGNPENQDVKLAFHNREHSALVASRVERLIDATNAFEPGRISAAEKAAAVIAAGGHDVEHVFYEADGIRKRKIGEGEVRSAARISVVKEAANNALIKAGKDPIFTIDPDKDIEDINVTIPSFSAEEGVTQKLLTRETPLTTRFLALADLADFGMDGPEKLLMSGRQIAIEDNSDIVEAIRTGTVDGREEEYRKRLLGTITFQPFFAQKRKERFQAELDGIEPESLKAEIGKEFRYFEGDIDQQDTPFGEAMAYLNEEVARVEGLSYDDLLTYIGIPRKTV